MFSLLVNLYQLVVILNPFNHSQRMSHPGFLLSLISFMFHQLYDFSTLHHLTCIKLLLGTRENVLSSS